MAEDASSFWTDIQRYEDMLAADPRSYCFAPLSDLYRRLGLLDDAIAIARKGCDLHPDYHGGFYALGAAYYDKGLTVEARQALERALALDPDDSRVQKMLGQLYAGAGETLLAKKVLGQVLRQNPDDLESELLLRSLASTLAAQPEDDLLDEAEIVELTDVVEEPSLAEEALPSVLADLSEPLEQETEELEELEELEEFWAIESPKESALPRSAARNPLASTTLAELYVSQGFIEKALTVYEDLLLADPTNRSYAGRVAELLELAGRQQEALRPAPVPFAAEVREAQEEIPASQEALETGLNSWLENIRRRRDGV